MTDPEERIVEIEERSEADRNPDYVARRGELDEGIGPMVHLYGPGQGAYQRWLHGTEYDGEDFVPVYFRTPTPDPPERCICIEPSPDLPGDTGVVMECPVHGEVAPPVKGENVREAICGTCDGVIPMYSNPCEYCGGTNVWPGSSPPVEEGERGERIRTLAERAVVLWDGKDLTAALSDETRVEKFAETFNELVDLIRARFPLGDDAAPDARQGEGDEA